MFGLFHGIVFLPVLLSLLGPSHDEDEVPGDQSDPKIEVNKPFITLIFFKELDLFLDLIIIIPGVNEACA